MKIGLRYCDFYFRASKLPWNWFLGIEVVPRSYCFAIHLYLVRFLISFEWFFGKIDPEWERRVKSV